MKRTTPLARLQYFTDNLISRNPSLMLYWLIIFALLVVVLIGMLDFVAGIAPAQDGKRQGLFHLLWVSLIHFLDNGNLSNDSPGNGGAFVGSMGFLTLFGIGFSAVLTGLLTNGISARLDTLRKGRSMVLESDHTLILGWNSQITEIISELCLANESRRSAAIVVLANRDKVAMEDELRARIAKPGRTRIICRSGDPLDLTDLEISNPHTARSIILLAPEDAPDPDATVIKTALALTNNPRRKPSKYHIVAELQSPSNLEAARLVGRHEAHWVLASELISRITVQTCRQSGLSVVYTELLDFGGDEIYFSAQPSLTGKSYFEAQLNFCDSCVMGLVKGDQVLLNPEAATPLEAGDRLILIAEDDSTIRLATPAGFDWSVIAEAQLTAPQPERTLVLGYNAQLEQMLHELNSYVAPGSAVVIVADLELPALPHLNQLTVRAERGDTTARSVLEALEPQNFDHIIVLAYKDALSAQQADAKTLISLLHLRDMAVRSGVSLNIVSEMLDNRNRELAEVTRADDFIVSDKLMSLMLAQVSENQQLADVFSCLFSSDGSEIYLRPSEQYIKPGASADFYTVLEAARRRGETAIGYRVAALAHSREHAYGVKVNPLKTQPIQFAPGDKIIVLAEN